TRGGGVDGIDHNAGRVTQNRRAPRADVIDHLISIDIPDVCALRALDEKWLAADAAEGAHGRVHAAGNASARGREEFARCHAEGRFNVCAECRIAVALTAPRLPPTLRAQRRGSQVVRRRSAKPPFVGSIPAPASFMTLSPFFDNRALVRRAGSIDSLSPESSHLRASSMSLGSRRLHSRPRLFVSPS